MKNLKKHKLSILIASLLASNLVYAEEAEKKEKDDEIERIEVTASGRSVMASQVPMNITAIGEDELRTKNITDVKRLIADSVEISSPGNSARFAESVTVRGLNVSPVNANNLERFVRTTMGYYLDDVPLPNIAYRIKDIQRVETLLGPQGTLYGAGSLGGTIRYITNKPQLDEFTFDAHSSLYQTKEGGLSHDTDFVINVPVSDTVALRASVAILDDAGYSDRMANPVEFAGGLERVSNPNPGQEIYEDDDWEETVSGKVALLWQPSDDFKLTLTHVNQDQTAHGTSGATRQTVDYACAQENLGSVACEEKYNRYNTPLQRDEFTYVSANEEYADRGFSMSSIDFDWKLSFADLHSSTSTFEDTREGQSDYLGYGLTYYGWISGLGLNDNNTSAYTHFDNSYTGFTHETRLTSNYESDISWIAGVYYTDTEQSLKFSEYVPGFDQAWSDQLKAWGVPSGFDRTVDYADTRVGFTDEGYYEDFNKEYTEFALYGEVTYSVTDALDLTAGIRYFTYEDKSNPEIVDYTGVTDSRSVSDVEGSDTIYKLNASYKITDDYLAYATFSQGFRRGGSNGFKNDSYTAPDGTDYVLSVRNDAQNYVPDTTNNYELGVKGYLLDNKLYFQTNIYKIEWENVQTYFSQTLNGLFPLNGTANGPSAETKGIELHTRYRLTDELSVKFAMAKVEGEWTDTKQQCLFDEVPSASEGDLQCRAPWQKGGKLGGNPDARYNYGLDYNTEIGEGYLFANINGRYVGKVQSDRQDAIDTAVYTRDAYSIYNASVGYELDEWAVTLWVDNLTDERAETSGQSDLAQGWKTIYVRPITAGVNLSYSFY